MPDKSFYIGVREATYFAVTPKATAKSRIKTDEIWVLENRGDFPANENGKTTFIAQLIDGATDVIKSSQKHYPFCCIPPNPGKHIPGR